MMKKIRQLIKAKIDEYFEEYPYYQEFAYSPLFWIRLITVLSIITLPTLLIIKLAKIQANLEFKSSSQEKK